MKRLHDLKNQLPGKARLNISESMRIKGGEGDKKRDRPSDSNPGQENGNAPGDVINLVSSIFGGSGC